MNLNRSQDSVPAPKLRRLTAWFYGCALLVTAVCSVVPGSSLTAQEPPAAAAAGGREGYLIPVELPLVGDRDELVKTQISRIAATAGEGGQRPIVVLEFRAASLDAMGEPDNAGLGTRGSQFERCLSLARFLTSAEASKTRLIAYLSETVVGHAVLPVLACEEVIAAPDAELGRAAIDEPVDATVEGAYRDMVARRSTLPEPVVMSMLKPTLEVIELELSDGRTLVTNRAEADKLREEGLVLRQDVVWPGGGQAAYSGQQLRARRWIARTVDDPRNLGNLLGVDG